MSIQCRGVRCLQTRPLAQGDLQSLFCQAFDCCCHTVIQIPKELANWTCVQNSRRRLLMQCWSCFLRHLRVPCRRRQPVRVQEPLQRLSGLHASNRCGRPECGPDPGAAEAPGKPQRPADRHVRHHRQVSIKEGRIWELGAAFFFTWKMSFFL